MKKQYVICIKNENYRATLEVRKVYQILEDTQTPNGFVRVIDESGLDYLFPERYFVPISIPKAVEFAFVENF